MLREVHIPGIGLSGRLWLTLVQTCSAWSPPWGTRVHSKHRSLKHRRFRSGDAWYNAGKRVFVLDFEREEGRVAFFGLLAEADIPIEERRPIGGPISLSEPATANPRLIRLSVSPMD